MFYGTQSQCFTIQQSNCKLNTHTHMMIKLAHSASDSARGHNHLIHLTVTYARKITAFTCNRLLTCVLFLKMPIKIDYIQYKIHGSLFF